MTRENMQQVYVVHYHEIALKGKNRPMFLRVLQENICRATGLPQKCVKIVSGRLVVFFNSHPERSSDRNQDEAEGSHTVQGEEISPLVRRGGLGRNDDIGKQLSHVFGISSFSPAVLVEAKYEEIEKVVGELTHNPPQPSLNLREGGDRNTFAIHATRGDKKFPMNSQELNVKLGAFVNEKFGKKVDLTNPDVTFFVEVFQGGALIYTEKIPGPGGLPVGTQGKVAVMLSGGIDSPVAAYRIMKRGASIIAVHCHSYPFTTRASIDKVKELAGILARYGGSIKLYLVPLADAQKAVVQNCEERYRVLLYRRLMVRITQEIARKEGAQALVTGEALGQVASQTLENMAVVEAVRHCTPPLTPPRQGGEAGMPIFRPLIGYDKEEIIAEAKRIGTYEVSILPHDDCCTLMMPKNPATRARLSDVEREERKLKMQEMITKTLEQTEMFQLK